VPACLLLALTQASFAGTPRIISIDPPGSIWTIVSDINATGTAVGYFEDAVEQDHGFIRSPSGQITIYDAPGALGTQIYAINDSGEMAGAYYTIKNTTFGFLLDQFGNISTFESSDRIWEESINATGLISGIYPVASENTAFTRDAAGDIITFAPPNAIGVQAAYIDAAGRVAGDYFDANVISHAYVRDHNGNFTTFDAPDAGTQPGRGTFVTHIADKGIITVGYSTDNQAAGHGFIRNTTGNITIFNVPGAGHSTSEGTYPYSINLSGSVAGFYVDSSRVSHGFVRTPSGSIVTFDAPNAGKGSGQGTVAGSMNSSGQIVGIYYDPRSVVHGLLRLTQ
jgi:hypothetical protein